MRLRLSLWLALGAALGIPVDAVFQTVNAELVAATHACRTEPVWTTAEWALQKPASAKELRCDANCFRLDAMKDAATFCQWKFFIEALLRIPIGLFLFGIALIVFPLMIGEEVAKNHGTWAGMFFAIFPLFLGYLFFSSGVRRLSAACAKNCWFKAGPDGISFRLPYYARPGTLYLTYTMVERTLTWKDVTRSYPVKYSVNGIPFGQALILDTAQGRFNFGGYFNESPAFILENFRVYSARPAS